MRLPHASSVVVALTTFVAVATVAAVVSQIAPLDRAGAALPLAPITSEPGDFEDTSDLSDPTSTPVSIDGVGQADTFGEPETVSPAGGTGGGPTVVAPAVAEPISEPDPQPDPDPTPAPAAPGNSSNAPGLGGTSPANENSSGSNKP